MKLLYKSEVVDDIGEIVFYEVTSYPDTITTSETIDPIYLTNCKPFHDNGKYNVRIATDPLITPQRIYNVSKHTSENILLIFSTPENYYEPMVDGF